MIVYKKLAIATKLEENNNVNKSKRERNIGQNVVHGFGDSGLVVVDAGIDFVELSCKLTILNGITNQGLPVFC